MHLVTLSGYFHAALMIIHFMSIDDSSIFVSYRYDILYYWQGFENIWRYV